MSENNKVRVWIVVAFLFVGLMAAISSFVATDEFLALQFFASFVGSLLAPTIVVSYVLLRAFTTTNLREWRRERRRNRAATLIVASVACWLGLSRMS